MPQAPRRGGACASGPATGGQLVRAGLGRGRIAGCRAGARDSPARHLSQRQLAGRMQVPRTYISKIENGKAIPTLGSLERLATALEVDVCQLVRDARSRREEEVAAILADPFLAEIAALLPHLDSLHRTLFYRRGARRGHGPPPLRIAACGCVCVARRAAVATRRRCLATVPSAIRRCRCQARPAEAPDIGILTGTGVSGCARTHCAVPEVSGHDRGAGVPGGPLGRVGLGRVACRIWTKMTSGFSPSGAV